LRFFFNFLYLGIIYIYNKQFLKIMSSNFIIPNNLNLTISNTNKPPAIIYKIVCNDTNINDSYVGATTKYKLRMEQHKHSCNHSNRKVYQSIRNNGGWNNWKIQILSVVPNWNIQRDYRLIEKAMIDLHKPNLNMNIPTRTTKEYHKQFPEKIKQYIKKYQLKHKEKVKANNLKWREKNRRKLADISNEWYAKNKFKIKQRNNTRFMCLCGNDINFHHFKFGKHKHCKKHHNMVLKQILDAKNKLKHNPLNINIFE